MNDDGARERRLTPEEEQVIVHRGTEPPFSGEYNDHVAAGYYRCKRCRSLLYSSEHKFKSSCGWPSFDGEVAGAVVRRPDPDGKRTEIVCGHCDGHLGHVFSGEELTPKNIRHCVNSISLDFIPREKLGRAIFAAGCFWGPEYFFRRAPGVLETTVGYTGGALEKPTYRDICAGDTGHAEAVEVIYDPTKTDFGKLCRLFFETHDPGQLNRQGPDVGDQYRSEIFFLEAEQQKIAQALIGQLKEKGHQVVTRVTPAGVFWPAEEYHQNYYGSRGKEPTCHVYRKKF